MPAPAPTPGSITIGQLARRTGMATSALRFYERKGLLRPIGRSGGQRRYRADSAEQIALIDLLKLAGFTLGEIAELIDPDGRVAPDWRERATAKLAELRGRFAELERARTLLEHTVACPEPMLHDCEIHLGYVRAHAAALVDGPETARDELFAEQ